MPKIKVLHIITRLDKGGSAENTLITVSTLPRERFELTLLSGPSSDPDADIARFIRDAKIHFVLIPDLVREISLRRDMKAFWQIYRFIKRGAFDIVHTHTSKAGILGRWAAKLAGVKIIIHTPHGHTFYGYFNRLKSIMFLYAERITALITDKIITLTQRGKEEHINYKIAKPEKFIPIYSGIDLKKFKDYQWDSIKEKQRLDIPLDAPLIGTVTRLEFVKGNQYFFSALPGIVDAFPNIRVFIVGDGSQLHSFERYSKERGIEKNVVFLGLCKDIARIVSLLDILVLSSLNEGMGKCLLEAQALGVPVVATRVGGIPEVVKEGLTGILVPAENSPALANAIIGLLRDIELRKTMAQEAKKWVDERFSQEAMVKKIIELYEELIQKN